MPKGSRAPNQAVLIARLLHRHGTTWAKEAGFAVRNSPAPLFRLLCLSTLLSARISSELSVRGTRALFEQGWTTPTKMAATTWAERTRALNKAGYARFDERTSRMLGESSEHVLNRWHGDLRNLREEAEREPQKERTLLKEHKGIGDVGVDIYFREVQGVWSELHPFLDERSRQAAVRIGLNPARLSKAVTRAEFPRLVAALVRIDLADGYDELKEGHE